MLPYLDNTYPTQDGDMLDKICIDVYGRWSLDVLLPVCYANPWVLQSSLLLPAGKILFLPAAPKTGVAVETIVMWQDTPAASVKVIDLLTNQPSSEYDGLSLLDYLIQYRRGKGVSTDIQSVVLEQDTRPFYGTLTNVDNEVYRYTPAAGFVGVDRFQMRATNGISTDTDVIEIVVSPSGSVNRFEVVAASELVARSAKLMFCAVKPTKLDAVQVFISRAEQGFIGSHSVFGSGDSAFIDVTLQKRLTSGGVVSYGDVQRIYNTKRTAAIALTGTDLNPGECLIAQVVTARGNVWGLFLDVYSTLRE